MQKRKVRNGQYQYHNHDHSESTAYCEYTMTVVMYYNCIHEKLKFIHKRLEKQEINKEKQVFYLSIWPKIP